MNVLKPLTPSRLALATAAVLASGCANPSNYEQYLEAAAADYDPAVHMVGTTWEGPAYHTNVAAGTRVHSTVGSLDYALALLMKEDDAVAHARAAKLIRTVIDLQETDVRHEYYGVWPWFLEEPMEEMSPPDRNWADFCGARLAQIYLVHGAELDGELRAATARSLRHAARAIRERDVDPGYTNIAIMGAGVAVAAGEALDEPGLIVWGRRKFAEVSAHVEEHSNFREYNSPNYTMVVLWECERALFLLKDARSRTAAEHLRQVAWRTIAESFHPGTWQWAGPHSRAYSDRMTPAIAHEIAARVGMRIPDHILAGGGERFPYWTAPQLPCPPEYAGRFAALPAPCIELRRTFQRGASDEDSVLGTTWMSADACLGSVNHACLWVQRRPLIGYWRTMEDPAVVLRLRALKNGRDFAALGVRTEQAGSRTWSNFYVLTDRGDWHRHLDPPKDNTYRVRDLRLRYELRGRGVTARKLGDGKFELRAGAHRAVLDTTPGEFFGQPIGFELGREQDVVYLDAILYSGAELDFDFRTAGIAGLSIDLEIMRGDEHYPSGAGSRPGR